VRFLLLYIRHFSLFDQSGPCAVAPGVCVCIYSPLFFILSVLCLSSCQLWTYTL
jgi:hypothetical protein